MTPIKEPCRVSTLSTPGNIFLGKLGPPGLPATGRAPRPVPASGPPAHRFMGACCTLVASPDSSFRTRLRPLLAAFSLIYGRAEGRARPRAPRREPLAVICEASAELVRPQRPERAWASESLSVLHISHQQRQTRCEAWCEERAGTASPEASMRAKGCVYICPINREKQRGDVRRNGASADLLVVHPRGFANMTERRRLVRPAAIRDLAIISDRFKNELCGAKCNR